MSTPTYEELLKGSTQWRGTKDDVSYLLSHHGYHEAEPHGQYQREGYPGTWCYYLLIPEQMYSHRWKDFACVRGDHGYENPGPAWDQVEFDTEITWSSSQPSYCRKTKRVWDGAKVGCDYAHSWHADMGYPDTYESVMRDAEKTVESFLKAHPDRNLRCGYSGVWGEPDEFYTAKNGRPVHNSRRGTFDDAWADNWEPAS